MLVSRPLSPPPVPPPQPVRRLPPPAHPPLPPSPFPGAPPPAQSPVIATQGGWGCGASPPLLTPLTPSPPPPPLSIAGMISWSDFIVFIGLRCGDAATMGCAAAMQRQVALRRCGDSEGGREGGREGAS